MKPSYGNIARLGLTALTLACTTVSYGAETKSTALPSPQEKRTNMDKTIVYIGTYTSNGKSKGIYIFEMDKETGDLTPIGTAPFTESPSFLALHPNHKYLYAVNEVDNFGGKKSGGVSAFAIAADTGQLTLLNQQPSVGDGPCHLSVDKTGKNVLVANYGGGSVAVLPVHDDGKLGAATCFIQHQGSSANKDRQESPHAHSINPDPTNHFAIAADLGLDKVFVYKLDVTQGKLTPNTPPSTSIAPGSGPRHFAFHPNRRYGYVISELLNTVTVFRFDSRLGTLKEIQALSTLPADFHGNSNTAEVQVHPSGKFLYGSNRGHNSITLFTIDQTTGKLTFVATESTQGKIPRNFGIDPSGNFLFAANQDSDSVYVYRIDQQTGKLTPTGHKVEVPMPVCVKFLSLTK